MVALPGHQFKNLQSSMNFVPDLCCLVRRVWPMSAVFLVQRLSDLCILDLDYLGEGEWVKHLTVVV